MISKIEDLIFLKAYAQVDGSKFFNFFTIPDKQVGNAKATFTSVLTTVFTWFLAIVAVIAFIYLVLNGVKYITAGGDAAKATEARQGIINAIIGIVVIVLAFFIMRFAVSLGRNLGNA